MSEIEMRLMRLERWSRRLSVAFIGLVAVPLVSATAGCSGWTWTTRAEYDLYGAPFYKSFSNTIHPQDGGVGHLPVTLYAEGRRLHAPQSLLDGIDSYLDSLGWSARLDASLLPARGAPYVDVRSEEESEFENYTPRVMILSTRTPSAPWRDSLIHIAEEASVEYVLYVSLGLSTYSKRTGTSNSREVELGTDYKMRLGWTDLDEPLAVVHIKGMLLDRNGKIVRAGAEGIIARDTNLGEELLYDLFGSNAEPSISADDIAGLSTEERREDLPGQPLKWKVATQNLLAQLLMREEVLRD